MVNSLHVLSWSLLFLPYIQHICVTFRSAGGILGAFLKDRFAPSFPSSAAILTS